MCGDSQCHPWLGINVMSNGTVLIRPKDEGSLRVSENTGELYIRRRGETTIG